MENYYWIPLIAVAIAVAWYFIKKAWTQKEQERKDNQPIEDGRKITQRMIKEFLINLYTNRTPEPKKESEPLLYFVNDGIISSVTSKFESIDLSDGDYDLNLKVVFNLVGEDPLEYHLDGRTTDELDPLWRQACRKAHQLYIEEKYQREEKLKQALLA